jgi:DNA-binding transcriptional LysR family regulator
MDRIDALTAFIAAADESSLAGASRRLGRSPAAVTRAIASLERRIGTRLLHRTTRVVRLTEAGEQYLAACRHIVAVWKRLTGQQPASAPHHAACST